MSLSSLEAHAEIPYADDITPGELRGVARDDAEPWPAGYWEYLPSNYNDVPEGHLYPLLMTLGGIGTMDNPSTCPSNTPTCTVGQCETAGVDGMCRVYRRGPAVEIRNGSWDDAERPFIVIQPQNRAATNSATDYDRDELDALLQFVLDNYPVDPRRLYLLGNSQGGRAVLQYAAAYNRRMTAITIGPGGLIVEGDVGCRMEDTAFWAFHGEDDADINLGEGVFNPCFIARTAHRYNNPDQYAEPSCMARVGTPYPEGRMTMFYSTAHNAWTPAFENVSSGFNQPAWTMDEACGFEANWVTYDNTEYADGVYTWLLTFDRPDTDAGDDFAVAGDATEFTLNATTLDDDVVNYTWTQTAGPAVTITDDDLANATITDFAYDQSYTFEVFAVDADGQWDRDTVDVTVDPEVIVAGSSSGGESSSSTGDGTTGDTNPLTTGGDSSSSHLTGADTSSGTDSDSTSAGDTTSSATSMGTTSASASNSASDSASATGPSTMSATATATAGETESDAGSGGGEGGSSLDDGGGCRTGGRAPAGWLSAMMLLGLVARRRR